MSKRTPARKQHADGSACTADHRVNLSIDVVAMLEEMVAYDTKSSEQAYAKARALGMTDLELVECAFQFLAPAVMGMMTRSEDEETEDPTDVDDLAILLAGCWRCAP